MHWLFFILKRVNLITHVLMNPKKKWTTLGSTGLTHKKLSVTVSQRRNLRWLCGSVACSWPLQPPAWQPVPAAWGTAATSARPLMQAAHLSVRASLPFCRACPTSKRCLRPGAFQLVRSATCALHNGRRFSRLFAFLLSRSSNKCQFGRLTFIFLAGYGLSSCNEWDMGLTDPKAQRLSECYANGQLSTTSLACSSLWCYVDPVCTRDRSSMIVYWLSYFAGQPHFEHIELPAKLPDYCLRSIKSNINQTLAMPTQLSSHSLLQVIRCVWQVW